MKNVIIFASGSGSNAENIANFFKNDPEITVSGFITNNPKAFVIDRAARLGVECEVFSKDDFYNNGKVLSYLKEKSIDLIVLAGFLWLVPEPILHEFPNRIINIHPALLPNYGGKGMYGDKVHEAVVANKEKESGITIPYINERYDEGEYIFQAKCKVLENDTPNDVAEKVHALEYKHYPEVIKSVLE